MSAVDYQGIRDEIETVLSADARTEGARVYVEEEPQFGLSDHQSVIAVFMDSRGAPSGEQSVSAGMRTRFNLRVSFWVVAFSLDSYRKACDERDGLLGQLELVLMDNRTLGGKVAASWLEGGEMFSAKDPQSSVFTAIAEVVMTLDVSAINT
ncbi:MAG: hypothetical protein U1E51_36360 [Candidatus Binatia bacterium]|nr:hypothetical protein [Candidatus Binatia bacterium]